MITDEMVEKALDYLRDMGEEAAVAKAQRIYLEEFRKVVKADIMKQHLDKAVNAQEREAYSDPTYKQHLIAMREAIEADERHRWMMASAQAKIEAWRTQQANRRGEAKLG
jgi:16S rRNA G966 N2-methylase RsmD